MYSEMKVVGYFFPELLFSIIYIHWYRIITFFYQKSYFKLW
jgi:hypothetical protein